ncbi:recombinase family protein [Gluconobacter sp. R71646]|uniref:Recombinase family protein n=1 Tax=Gluconobacter potus TaxID=2724927 RepID=A0ABR9YPS2_9PROT|nr:MULTISPECIES: recombinase family protein [Gluconobacter]MBF0865432.1 recombinase family protein [Gluconobacter sp. R71656]MBF0868854.1 recombinase family protein [Gluconobacter sp. R75628]MBF0874785.1 recombinase family protein [Gluconobacter sp. R75629]MBF0883463.1 recombinase family protein [Gluconobacter potus]
MKVALYARYSSDNQRDASIEDQLRLCREYAARQDWNVVDSYSDRAVSGASLLRPGIQELMQDAQRGKFSIILAEAMDRLSRDQEDIAGLFKRMKFAGVRIITLSEGDVTQLHVGLKGTMNALFLQDLADKTRRGIRGRVEAGKSGGGLCYGYDVVRKFDAAGEAVRGERSINISEAAIVRRIFREYADGKAPRAIALDLNAEGIVGPLGGAWGPSTIHGNRDRGTGILNNELYIGRLIWNRLRYLKDPETGKRVSRLNPESEWILQEVPELRIVEPDLWEATKARQATTTWSQKTRGDGVHPLNSLKRPRHLFTAMTRCGCCGGGFSMISKNLLGCSTARNKGTCDNRMTIRRDMLEKSVLNGLRTRLMDPALFKEFCDEFTREVNRVRMERGADLAAMRAELPRVDRELDKAIQAILDGVPGVKLKDKIGRLEARKEELTALLADAPQPPPLLHPNMAVIYRERIEALYENLQKEDASLEAIERLRGLVSRIKLIPLDGELAIFLEGDLAAILNFSSNKKSAAVHPDHDVLQSFIEQDTLVAGTCNRRKLRSAGKEQATLVAGAGFEPAAFRL